MTNALQRILKHSYYLYFTFLPVVTLTLFVIYPERLPAWVFIDSGLVRIALFVFIIAIVSTYIGTTTELTPFPAKLGAAMLSAFGIPVSFIIATVVNGDTLVSAIFMSCLVEFMGMLFFLLFMVNKKFFVEKDRFWFGLVIVYGLIISTAVFLIVLWFQLANTTWITVAGVATSAVVIAQRYYQAIKQGAASQDNVVYILLGLFAILVVPGVTALIVYWEYLD